MMFFAKMWESERTLLLTVVGIGAVVVAVWVTGDRKFLSDICTFCILCSVAGMIGLGMRRSWKVTTAYVALLTVITHLSLVAEIGVKKAGRLESAMAENCFQAAFVPYYPVYKALYGLTTAAEQVAALTTTDGGRRLSEQRFLPGICIR